LTNPRWPTQLIGAMWALLLFLWLWLTRKQAWLAGTRYWLFIAAYSLGAFVLGFTRGDDVLIVGGWRIDQVLDALLLSTALIALARLRLKQRSNSRPDTSIEASAGQG